MTSQGSPYARVRRALETTRSQSAIRDGASELGQVGLEDGVQISRGATGQLLGNIIEGNEYTGSRIRDERSLPQIIMQAHTPTAPSQR